MMLKTKEIFSEKYLLEQQKLIHAFPELLELHEFDNKILNAAEKFCGFKDGYSLILFPKGLSEVLDHLILYFDSIMINQLLITPNPSKIREKIELSLNLRIKSLKPHIHSKIGAYLANHLRAMEGFKYAWRTSDTIWRFWRDDSVDFNYYSKRSLLTFVYLSSILHFISDSSDNYTSTDKFIKSSIENVVKAGKFKQNIMSKFKQYL